MQGKTVLITGAARRVGRSIALACAAAGAHMVLHYRNSASEAAATASDIKELGVSAWTVQGDLASADAADTLMQKANQHGPISVLVNNASVFAPVTAESMSTDDWESHLRVNLTAPVMLTRAFAATLPEGHTGRVLNLVDWRATKPQADHFPYTVSKSALVAATQAMALTYAPRISINALALGAILPPEGQTPDSRVLERVPMSRWSTLQELQNAALFLLAGPQYITGEVLYLDGGRHLY